MQGVFEHLHAAGIKAPEPVGLQVMVHGVVPLGGCSCTQLSHSGAAMVSPMQSGTFLIVLDAGRG